MVLRFCVNWILVFCFVLIPVSSYGDGEWVLQETPDVVDIVGCWSVIPTNYNCDGNDNLIDGDDETGSFSYVCFHDATLNVGYLIPEGAEIFKWVIICRDGSSPPSPREFAVSLEGISQGIIDLRIKSMNTGMVGSPFSFQFLQENEWIDLYTGNASSPLVTAQIFEERVFWFINDTVNTDPVSFDQIKAIFSD